jgi:hypothetical protein
MLKKSVLGVLVLFLAVVAFVGCASKPVAYQYVTEGVNSASISFKTGNPYVRCVSFEGADIPAPERGTYWEPVIFPAGRALRITVYVYYEYKQTVRVGGMFGLISDVAGAVGTLTRSVDRNVVFTCPPLADGGKYQLEFEKGSGIPGTNTLVLRNLATREVVYQQEFPSSELSN